MDNKSEFCRKMFIFHWKNIFRKRANTKNWGRLALHLPLPLEHTEQDRIFNTYTLTLYRGDLRFPLIFQPEMAGKSTNLWVFFEPLQHAFEFWTTIQRVENVY